MRVQPDYLTFSPFDGHRYDTAKTLPQRTEWFRVNASEIWQFDPWTGEKRDQQDIDTDPHGREIWCGAIWRAEWSRPQPVPRPGMTFLCECPPGAKLFAVGTDVFVIAPNAALSRVTPTGLEPVPVHGDKQ